MRKWEVRRYTLSQLANALRQDSDDPHAGQLPVTSMDQLDALWDEAFGDE